MDLSLIISTYNQPDYLARVLNAVSRQTAQPEEVLLADDGSGEETKRVFSKWAGKKNARAEHVFQPHEGFRKARILNQAIARARGEYLVFLDGDMIPHPNFLADHRQAATPDAFVQGHRALVGERAAAFFGQGKFTHDRRRALLAMQLQGWKHAFRWPRPLMRRRQDLRGIRGCNQGIWREDLEKINGYNEAFVGWGREDSELAVRLMNLGVERLDLRGWALTYHLWHPRASRAMVPGNDTMLAEAITRRVTRCEQGLDQYTGK